MTCVLAETAGPYEFFALLKKEQGPGSGKTGAVWMEVTAGTPAPEAARRIAEARYRLRRPLVAALEVGLPAAADGLPVSPVP